MIVKTRALMKEVQKLDAADIEGHYPGASLVEWFAGAGDAEMWRINVYLVAERLEADRGRLLATFSGWSRKASWT